ncbi:MAG TPA: sensor histidine kinase [Clostridia bacterium]|nr:sensor histidine kinase [Clostridia bacterium]
MMGPIFAELLNKMGFIILCAYLLSRLPQMKRVMLKSKINWQETILLSVAFGIIGILGTYFGIPVQGAIANSRVVGVLAGALLAGPWVGFGAGLLAGGHRFLIDIGGFTALACGLSTFTEGILGGIFYMLYKGRQPKWYDAFYIGLIAEMMQMGIILLVAKPFSAALELVKVIWLPMVTVNALGVALMVAIIQSIYQEKDRIGAHAAQIALKIANQTLPYFRKGLTPETALQAAKIIMNSVPVDAVAITDTERTLAHVGIGHDHHRPNQPIMTRLTTKVLRGDQHFVANSRAEIGCPFPGCPLGSAVTVPLKEKDRIIGALKLYRAEEQKITTVDVELTLGLAQLFSTQLELARIEYQASLLNKAELKALQAQINPHFLFNALNTITSLVRSDPEKARHLLVSLGDFFRNNLQQAEDLVPLHRELQHVRSYVALEEARFGDKLKVIFDIDPSFSCYLPPFTLQPLVENAIKHGLLPKKHGGTVTVCGTKDKHGYLIKVIDNGVGIEPNRIKKLLSENGVTGCIGIANVNNRLKNVFGPECGLQINSNFGQGTEVVLRIPKNFTEVSKVV